jgi:hypothetical protein
MSADEGAAAEAPAAGRHKRSLLAPKIKRMMQACQPPALRCASASLV